VGGNRPQLARGAEEDLRLQAERLREGPFDPFGELGTRLAIGLEDDVAAGAEGGHVREADLLEQRAELYGADSPPRPEVDPAQEGGVLGHVRNVAGD
jgi:hypothetical protein